MGYSERDIQYFGGYKRKRSIYGPDRTRVPSGSKTPVKVNDSTADILAKIYNLMRKIDDFRPDSIVKVELLAEIREKYGEPYLWVDDRKTVVEAIRNAGVRVLQVCEGDY